MSCRTRKRKEDEERKANDGEQDNLFTDRMRKKVETIWEIPQIFHFLHLAKESLNLPQLSLYEMERMLLIPRASKQLANIMTCLLSSPTTKAKLRKVPPMPYEFWTNILAYKMTSWFKIYRAKHEDATKVLETIGVEPEFWNVFPESSLLDGRDFKDLSFKQRVWLLKTVCDTIMHTRKTVQEDMVNQPWDDQFETVLGIDRNGARYIYFPQFMPNDLRIYRHSLDNKILSTVKPAKPKQETETSKLTGARLTRFRKRKSQLHNNLPNRRSSRRKNGIDDKDLCNNDSATGSFISEDTNLSSTSTCSNNNNNISLDVISRKRCRSLSKMSEESTLSNAKSSGYDTHTSSDNKSVDDESSMFKGFTNTQNDNCNIGIINEMLDDLKSEIDEEKRANERESNSGSELVTQGNFVELYKNTTVSYSEALTVEKDENERLSDNLSSSSKTDDEKLNEIINAESSKLPEDVYSKNISVSDNVSDISMLTSKSDDEKLSETKTCDNNASVSENNLNRKTTFNESNFYASSSIDSASLSEEVAGHQRFNEMEVSPSMMEAESSSPTQKRNLRKGMRLRSQNTVKQYKTEATKDKMKKKPGLEDERYETDEENFSASEMRLQENMEHDLDDYTNNLDTNYNLRRSKDPKTDERKQHFNKMLSDLSVSDFYLVADSVEELRDLIASFSTNDSESNSSNNAEIIPLCEIKLAKRLTELLTCLEPMETTLKDAMRKAKAKLQREWSNFKEGAGIHCQLPETQRYKRYRNLPYPYLAPKTPKNRRDKSRASTKVQPRIPSRLAARAGKQATNSETEATRNGRMSRCRREETKSREAKKKKRNGNASNTERMRARRTTKMQNRRNTVVDECYERAASHRTQNSFIHTTRAMRTSWKNGPTLRQSTRLPAHRPVHPLLTLIRKTETLATGRTRRTQTKIGFYRALAKGKINVRLPIED